MNEVLLDVQRLSSFISTRSPSFPPLPRLWRDGQAFSSLHIPSPYFTSSVAIGRYFLALMPVLPFHLPPSPSCILWRDGQVVQTHNPSLLSIPNAVSTLGPENYPSGKQSGGLNLFHVISLFLTLYLRYRAGSLP